MKRKNMISMVTSLALVGVVAVGGTLALLSAQSNHVKNTFTVGNNYPDSALELKEAKVEQAVDGSYVAAKPEVRVAENDYKQLVSNTTLAKDPTFTLATGSPTSWIVAYVGDVDPLFTQDGKESEFVATDWYAVTWNAEAKEGAGAWEVSTTPVEGNTIAQGYYVYGSKVIAGGETSPVFESLNVGDVTKNATDGTKVKTLYVVGAAVEALETDTAMDNDTIGVIMAQLGTDLKDTVIGLQGAEAQG